MEVCYYCPTYCKKVRAQGSDGAVFFPFALHEDWDNMQCNESHWMVPGTYEE